MKAFTQAQFLASSAGPADMPPPGPPELAFAGRSNVGKSSAINALTGRKRLAFTSKTPGRTQTINFFELGGARLVDLPGYGYAKVPQALRAQWRTLVGSYITSRDTLAGIVLVMDARHPLTPLDLQLLAFLGGDTRLLALLSKADKLPRAEQANTLASVRESLRGEVRLFSSLTRQGVDECRDLLEGWLSTPAPQQVARIKNPR